MPYGRVGARTCENEKALAQRAGISSSVCADSSRRAREPETERGGRLPGTREGKRKGACLSVALPDPDAVRIQSPMPRRDVKKRGRRAR